MIMARDKVLSLLGLCQRAGELSSGGFASEEAVKKGKARLMILAGDSSEASLKNYRDMCAYYHVPVREYGTKEELGRALGKEYRAVAVVKDDGFAKSILRILDGDAGGEGK